MGLGIGPLGSVDPNPSGTVERRSSDTVERAPRDANALRAAVAPRLTEVRGRYSVPPSSSHRPGFALDPRTHEGESAEPCWVAGLLAPRPLAAAAARGQAQPTLSHTIGRRRRPLAPLPAGDARVGVDAFTASTDPRFLKRRRAKPLLKRATPPPDHDARVGGLPGRREAWVAGARPVRRGIARQPGTPSVVVDDHRVCDLGPPFAPRLTDRASVASLKPWRARPRDVSRVAVTETGSRCKLPWFARRSVPSRLPRRARSQPASRVAVADLGSYDPPRARGHHSVPSQRPCCARPQPASRVAVAVAETDLTRSPLGGR